MIDIVSLWQAVGVGIAVPIIFLFIFWYADGQVHENLRKSFAKFLVGESENKPSADLTTTLVSLFDVIFGPRLWSWKFLLRSLLASVMSLIVMIVIWFILNPEELAHRSLTTNLMQFVIVGAIVNLLPDCVSLAETRIIIRKMENRRAGVIVLSLLVDLVITTTIIFCSIFGFASLLSTVIDEGLSSQRILTGIIRGYSLNSDNKSGEIGVFIYTTYFTSVWIWLYMISAIMMRFRGAMCRRGGRGGRVWRRLRRRCRSLRRNPAGCRPVRSGP